jgi:polyphosphate kinase
VGARRIETPSAQWTRAANLLERAGEPSLPADRRLRLLALSSRCLDTVFEGAEPAPRDGRPGPWPTAAEIRSLVERQEWLLTERVLPDLARQSGIEVCGWDDLSDPERRRLVALFEDRIFPVLTPLRIGPAHPSPRLASLALHMGILASDDEEEFFARVELPAFLPRFVALPGGRGRHLALEEIVATRIGRLFPGATIESVGAFRVTRSHRSAGPDLAVGASGPLPPRGEAVRLECDARLDPTARHIILAALALGEDDLYLRRTPIELGALDGLVMAP